MTLLTREELAVEINIKASTISQWVMQKRIPYIKIGKLVRFEKEKVMEWIEQKRVKPAA
jgi:excisionase family DNA binding protein